MIERGGQKKNAEHILVAPNKIVREARGKGGGGWILLSFRLLVIEKATCLVTNRLFRPKDKANLFRETFDESIVFIALICKVFRQLIFDNSTN